MCDLRLPARSCHEANGVYSCAGAIASVTTATPCPGAVHHLDPGKDNPMKVVAFNGSPRKDGNTSILIHHVFAALNAEGIETELVSVGGNLIHGCTACYNASRRRTAAARREGHRERLHREDARGGRHHPRLAHLLRRRHARD